MANEWQRMSGEPARWYTIFIKYYVGGGFSRSVRSAWLAYLKEYDPEKYEAALGSRGVPKRWHAIAARWEWLARAEAWESYQSELSMAAVEAASRRLRELAPGAVEALAGALAKEKTAVRAAAEILNRGGLPAVSRQEIDQTLSLSSDDMAKAAEELEEWESSKKKSN